MVDPLVLNPSNISATSHEELSKLDSIEDSETFLAPKESSESSREPRDDVPPDIQRESPESDEFQDLHVHVVGSSTKIALDADSWSDGSWTKVDTDAYNSNNHNVF